MYNIFLNILYTDIYIYMYVCILEWKNATHNNNDNLRVISKVIYIAVYNINKMKRTTP